MLVFAGFLMVESYYELFNTYEYIYSVIYDYYYIL